MNKVYNWNAPYVWVMTLKDIYKDVLLDNEEIKEEYAEIYAPFEFKTCIERWIKEIGEATEEDSYFAEEYKDFYEKSVDIFSKLEIKQKGTLVILHYNTYASYDKEFWNSYDGFFRETRSLVIDLKTEEIILCPMRKFFNINEMPETSVQEVEKLIVTPFSIVEFSNKLDGSFIQARWHNNQLYISSSGCLDETTCDQLRIAKDMLAENYIKMLKEYTEYTFMFELISHYDPHVVTYSKEKQGLYLIAMRKIDGFENSYKNVREMAEYFSLFTTDLYDTSFSEIMNSLDDYKSTEKEGWVINIINGDGINHRFKLKVNDYVIAHRLFSSLASPNTIIEAIREDKYDDLVAKIDLNNHTQIIETANTVFSYVEKIDKVVKNYYNLAPKDGEKKEFMVWINKNVPALFQGYVRGIYLNQKLDYLKGRTFEDIKRNLEGLKGYYGN